MLCAFLPHPGNKDRLPTNWAKVQSFQMEQYSSTGKESTCNAGDPASIPGSGRSPGEGNGYPLQYSIQSMGSTKSRTGLSDFHFLLLPLCGYMPESQGAHLVLETFDKYGASSVTNRENLQFWLSNCPTKVPLTCSDALGWNDPSENTTVINGYPFKAVLSS